MPGVYEGGYKLWEGAADLARFMHAEATKAEGAFAAAEERGEMPAVARESAAAAAAVPPLGGARVLELGCGHALPAIVAAHHGAASVTLQDFNAEVLAEATAPAVLANEDCFASDECRVRYLAGSWEAALAELRPAGAISAAVAQDAAPEPAIHRRAYDLVLGSELWYAERSMRTLATLVSEALADGSTACALIAGKAHYFGVGGSARGFEAAARAEGLEHEVVWRKADGASNVREIIRLRRRRDGGRGGSSNGGGDGGDGSTEREPA